MCSDENIAAIILNKRETLKHIVSKLSCQNITNTNIYYKMHDPHHIQIHIRNFVYLSYKESVDPQI
jgi:hypothetical protein